MISNKYFYYVFTQQKDGKFYSYVERIHASYNLASVIKSTPNVYTVNTMTSKKTAYDLANFWNDTYILNGTYLFD